MLGQLEDAEIKALSWEEAQYISAVVLQPEHALESTGELFQIAGSLYRVSNSGSLGWGPRIVFLASSHVIMMMLVWGVHFQNHCGKRTAKKLMWLEKFE